MVDSELKQASTSGVNGTDSAEEDDEETQGFISRDEITRRVREIAQQGAEEVSPATRFYPLFKLVITCATG